MIKNIFGGIMVGIANIIPGVSGGTMMVILGLFDRVMNSVSSILKKDNDNRMADLIFLTQVLFGAAIGIIGFANIIAFLLDNYKYQTMWWFSGLIICSLPSLMKSELQGKKLDYRFTVAGLAIIALLVYLNPGKVDYDYRTLVYPDLNVLTLATMFIVGAIAGATMLFPGISGAMVLLIINQYYFFTGYIKSVIHFELDKLIPCFFIGLGILFGIIASAKVTSNLLESNRNEIISFIVGLIIMSSFVLLPNPIVSIHQGLSYTPMLMVTCIGWFLFGGVILAFISNIKGQRTS